MATKQNDRHLEKAEPGEQLFVLLARDGSAPQVIVEWIKQNLSTQPPDKLREALDCAITMQQTHINHVGKVGASENAIVQIKEAIRHQYDDEFFDDNG